MYYLTGNVLLKIPLCKGTRSCSSRVIHKFHCFDKANYCMETNIENMNLAQNNVIQRQPQQSV